MIAFLQEVFEKKTLKEAIAWLSGLDLCFAPVNTLPEAFADANVAARASLLVDALGRRHIAPVIRFGDEPARPVLMEPTLGADSEEILQPLQRRATTPA